MTPLFQTLPAAQTWLFKALAQAARDPGDAWHLGSLSYFDINSRMPVAKTIVLREWDAEIGALSFFTDTRSGKWRALEAHNQAAILFYCPARRVQLSLSCGVHLSTATSETVAQFAGLSKPQQEAYISTSAPGAPQGQENWPGEKRLDPDLAAQHFGIVNLSPLVFDFVSLHKDGHQRISGQTLGDRSTWSWRIP